MDKEFELLLKALFSAIKIPISFFDMDGILQIEFYYKRFTIPSKIRKDIIWPLLLKKHSDGNIPEIYKSYFNESYFSMAIITNNKFKGTLVVGPFMTQRMLDEDIIRILQDLDIGMQEREEIGAFYKRLRLLTTKEANEIAVHIHYYFYRKILNVDDIKTVNRNDTHNIDDIRRARDNNIDIYSPDKENYVITAVKNGESQVFEQIDIAFLRDNLGISLSDSIDKIKTIIRDFIVVLADVIVGEGITQETANDILTKFTRNLEHIDNINDMVKFVKNVFIDFTERIAKLKNDASSKTIWQCKQYIMNNPYSEITLKNLSELVGLNPSYLSRLFKVATGISVTEYSKMEKIEEAKIMIETDSHTLSEISVLLGFYDYNHFVKVFKAITNTTPNQYKRYNTRKPARNI